MDIKDVYLHGGVGVVKSIDEISDGQLKYTLSIILSGIYCCFTYPPL